MACSLENPNRSTVVARDKSLNAPKKMSQRESQSGHWAPGAVVLHLSLTTPSPSRGPLQRMSLSHMLAGPLDMGLSTVLTWSLPH